jgi:uncharacterized tellurite resistance protein B-like protein
MFLRILNEAERQAFLALAREYIQADQKVTPQEEELLKVFCLEMGLDPALQLPAKPRAEWYAAFRARPARVAALLELFALACADKDFDRRERELVFETAKAFGIPEHELKALADWNDKHLGLLSEAFALMQAPAPPPLPKGKGKAAAKPKPKPKGKPRTKAKVKAKRKPKPKPRAKRRKR